MADEKLVMVNKDKLRALRDEHRAQLLDTPAALDALLTEIINGENDGR